MGQKIWDGKNEENNHIHRHTTLDDTMYLGTQWKEWTHIQHGNIYLILLWGLKQMLTHPFFGTSIFIYIHPWGWLNSQVVYATAASKALIIRATPGSIPSTIESFSFDQMKSEQREERIKLGKGAIITSVGRVVASNNSGPKFKSGHWQNLNWFFVFCQLYWKVEDKSKK